MTDKAQRQDLGCGFELPIEGARPWPGLPDGKHGFRQHGKVHLPTVCPGYSTNLPEVREVSRAYRHWDKGQLRDFCGEQPTEAMMMAVEILDAEVHANQSWQMAPANEGGGRK